MANDLQALSYQALARCLSSLAPSLAMIRNGCNFIYDPLATGTQASIKIPNLSEGLVRTATASTLPPEIEDTKATAQYLDVTTWKERPFRLDDDEFETLQPGSVIRMADQAALDLAKFINADLIDRAYRAFNTYVGTPGTPLFSSNAMPAIAAARKLTDQLAPDNDRMFVMDTGSYYDAVGLQQFAYLNQSGEAEVMREATIPRRYGFGWSYDQQMGRHTTGTASGYTTGANVAGLKSIVIQSGTGAWVAGDIVTIGSDTYAVESGTTTLLNLSTGLKAATVAGQSIVKLASHGVNLAFQKEAICFATRPLPEANDLHNQLGKKVYQMTDKYSGLSMRIIWSSLHNRISCTYQTLYGIKVVRPEFGCRVIY